MIASEGQAKPIGRDGRRETHCSKAHASTKFGALARRTCHVGIWLRDEGQERGKLDTGELRGEGKVALRSNISQFSEASLPVASLADKGAFQNQSLDSMVRSVICTCNEPFCESSKPYQPWPIELRSCPPWPGCCTGPGRHVSMRAPSRSAGPKSPWNRALASIEVNWEPDF